MDEPCNCLVTGATGFIGSHLVRVLSARHYTVMCLVRPTSDIAVLKGVHGISFATYDGTLDSAIQALRQAKANVVFHLASHFVAEHKPQDIDWLVESNLKFGLHLLEAMRLNDVRFLVNAGTSWQNFHSEGYRPVCLYAATKQAFEDLLAYYTDSGAIEAVTLRLYDIYGPNDPRPKLVNLLVRLAQQPEPLYMSEGEQLMDIVHVKDAASAFLRAKDRLLRGHRCSSQEVFAVSSGNPLSLRKLVETFEQVIGRQLPIAWGRRPYRTREVMVPWQTGDVLPGWKPTVNLGDGLAELMSEIRLSK